MKLMYATIALVALVLTQHPESEAAFRDRSSFASTDAPYIYYLSLSEVESQYQVYLEKLLRSTLPNLSSKYYLAEQIPVRVPNTALMRFDLRGLGWEISYPWVIRNHYVPKFRQDLIHTKQIPLVVSGLWFATNVTDTNITGDSLYRLLFGTVPRNEKEFKALHSVNGKGDLSFGFIEGKSGVARELTRLIENAPTANRAYFWQTYDSRVVAGSTDPLQNITARPPKHDASELIGGIPKWLGDEYGVSQTYFLSNAKGERQEKAPANIVTDSTGTRGVEILNYLSCRACHSEGLQQMSVDSYEAYILSGARIYTKDKHTQIEIDRYLDSPIAKEIIANNKQYATFIRLCNGLTVKQDCDIFKRTIQFWDGPVNLAQAAREVYAINETELQSALGKYSTTKLLSSRLSELSTGNVTISRNQWIEDYYLAQKSLYLWRTSK